jgi:DNA polymerase-3 subunit epsilon
MRAGHDDRITEIAVATLAGDTVELAYDALVNPERPIPPFITALTSITDEMVRNRPTFDEVAGEVLTALSGRVFAAHNAPFDWRFVTTEVRRARGVLLDGPRVCTVRLARRLLPGLRSRGLDSVTNYFGIEVQGRHRAAGDALATARVLQRLLGLAADQGATTLDELARVDLRRAAKKSALPTPMPEA